VNILALNLGLSIYLWVGTLFEERKLIKAYGAAYEEYMQRTPMLIPKFESLKEK
jgi:protein-S-isoprenylcysteine O-methyltransferase Ste14